MDGSTASPFDNLENVQLDCKPYSRKSSRLQSITMSIKMSVRHDIYLCPSHPLYGFTWSLECSCQLM